MTLRPSRTTKAATTANPMQSTAALNAGSQAGTYYPQVPSIRLISATPSATGISPDSSTSFNQSLEESWATMSSQLPVPLAPKNDEQSRKRLVPKKSKLSILGMGRDKEKDRGKDLSDVVRRVGATNTASTRGGFEIYVDPTDPEIGEIVMVKKKKSRVALDGMSWGALGEVTNVPKAAPPMPPMKKKESSNNLLKVKVDEEKKWWSIGRGRKDSKEKNKENKSSINAQPVEFIYKPEPRSKTPEPFKPAQESRGRFNSLDSGLLFGKAKDASVRSTNTRSPSPVVQVSEPEAETKPPSIRERARSTTPMFGRSMTPTLGGLLAPPSGAGTPTEEKTGSIAVRAMKSMRSLARMGSWAQLKNMPPPTAQEMAEEMARAESEGGKEKEKDKKSKAGSVKEKKKKEKKVDENGNAVKRKSAKKEKSQTLRMSSSSFEVGHLSASPEVPKTLGTKKHSILGLGLPASMRLPTMRGGSTASSINFNLLSSSAQANPGAVPSSASISISPNVAVANLAPQANRLSVESAIPQGRDRSASVASSNGSSLRPVSIASSNSRLSSGSSVVSGISGTSGGSSGVSVRWDEEGLETVREQRRKDREVRRMSEDSEPGTRRTSRESMRRSLEARKRMPLSGVFEEVHHHQVGVAMMKDLTEVTEEESKVVEAIVGPEQSFLPKNVKRLSAESAESARTTSTSSSIRRRRPILTIEEATADGHAFVDEDLDEDDSGRDEDSQDETDSNATPAKKARQRPLSEQMLGKSRPKPMHEDDEGVISILSAATQDLALLLNTLDLQATPGTPDMTPFKPSPLSTAEKDTSVSASATPSSHDGSPQSKSTKARVALGMDSPLKNTLRGQVASIASLRPYAQSRKNTTSPPSKVVPATVSSPLASSTATIRPKPPTINKSTAELISQQIAPWPVLMEAVSPAKPKVLSSPATINKSPAASLSFKPGHKRTMTPAPEPEAEPVFQPLKPARSRAPTVTANMNGMATIRPVKSKVGLALDVFNNSGSTQERDLDSSLFSARTFGPKSATLSKSSKGSMTLDELSTIGSSNPTPVFRRVQEFEARKEATLSPLRGSKGSRLSVNSTQLRAPIGRETRKILGMSGTLGGSDVSMYDGPEPDSEDPDSDVPDELRFLLATHSNRTSVAESAFQDETELHPPRPISMDMFAPPPASTLPPSIPPPPVPSNNPPFIDLPIFRASLLDDDQNQLEIDCGFSNASDEDTKKSFDFTGEIRMLNESGASDRASFVEQLEQAFKTPAKVDLRYDFNHLLVEVPPVPALPIDFRMAMTVEHPDSSADTSAFDSMANSQSHLLDVRQPSMLEKMDRSQTEEPESKSDMDMFTVSKIADIQEPTLMHKAGSEISDQAGDVSMDSSVELGRSTGSRSSDGELNRSFRFGGIPQFGSNASLTKDESKPLTLSDIIPPPLEARAISEMSMMSDDLEDESVLKSIYAKLLGNDKAPVAQPSAAARQHSSTHSNSRAEPIVDRHSIYRATSRPTSGISFGGLDSFEEVRRGFEFSGDRSFYPPPPARNGRRVPHRRDESLFSIASVSSYGHVLNNGVNDPFDYGLPSLQERPSSEDVSSISMSMTVDDTFEFLRNQPRRRVDSDASSFYFQAPAPGMTVRGHRRRESNISVTSQGPPISLYNRSFGHHRRNDSNTSINSASISYSKYGNQSAAPAWTRHNRDLSVDSVMSDFSVRNFERPGLGDKMFDNAVDHGPLTSITASPPEHTGISDSHFANRDSYDSIMDEQPQAMGEDSIFEKTGQRISVSSDSVFGDDESRSYQAGLLPPHQFRPLSMWSDNSFHNPPKEDDTMITMLGGGHVRRCSVGSIIEASPCVRVEKRKHSAIQQGVKLYKNVEQYESPNKARIVEKPSIASTSSFQFGGERMIRAQHGLLERQSLEDSALIADGEDISGYCMPLFTRPAPTSRSRSSTCTSSSGTDTPPLSASDGSSTSDGSQSSIDLSQLNVALSNATHPLSSTGRHRTRARARGTGHRRRYSKANMSRSSVYETIEEEVSNTPSPLHSLHSSKDDSTTHQAVFIVEEDTASINTVGDEPVWDEERGIVALRKFYALRDEVETTVSESRRIWLDTPFSLYAVQAFQPPQHPAGMQALLEHSVQSFGPLPSELRIRTARSRTSSRPSPYPHSRITKTTVSPDTTHANAYQVQSTIDIPALRPLRLDANTSAAPSLDVLKSLPPLDINITAPRNVEVKADKSFGLPPAVRPRVPSNDRRTALGWTKRSNGAKSSNGKENIPSRKENSASSGSVMTPGDTLRLNRPRPKGRTPGGRTPASQNRSIRV
ncbi:hypothetical protein CPB83DRAFT_855475 [Crepidotus variabilis]|uniref:Uncharacterized protein n=1 Tax=Crepidotus variabilis TaxID=179855 RepID=A0A9P6JP94_9AGAR|nr:hypothetical protein CPB83DRAFT_855475 [Crepidotus variabilis]